MTKTCATCTHWVSPRAPEGDRMGECLYLSDDPNDFDEPEEGWMLMGTGEDGNVVCDRVHTASIFGCIRWQAKSTATGD